MRELTPDTTTDDVLEPMATTPDLRLRTIMAGAARHLHAVAREIHLTPAEEICPIEGLLRASADLSATLKQSEREAAPPGAG